VSARFVIYLSDDKNLSLLNLIKSYFEDSGSVILDKKTNKASFTISKFSDLTNLIIPHFQKFPLQSSKLTEYSLWLNCIRLMENNEHLTKAGVDKILSIKGALNKGLSPTLTLEYPGIVPIEKSSFSNLATDKEESFPLDSQ